MNDKSSLAIIGAGPSALFALQHLLESGAAFFQRFDRLFIFERDAKAGMGMPYSPTHTSALNLSNISSEELPPLPLTFAEWLRAQSFERLSDLGIERPIKDDEIYPRVALGFYFHEQFELLCAAIRENGVAVECLTGIEVHDIEPSTSSGYEILTTKGDPIFADVVVIATGHTWPRDLDQALYASPWPIHKLLPEEGTFHNFSIGLLGASLSAVDVINVLAHRHGSFEQDGDFLKFRPAPGADEFRLVMHSADGLLSHLQFEQVEPMRELNRHCSEEEISALVDEQGFLRLSTYFDQICRQPLAQALLADGLPSEADRVERPESNFREFSEMMKEKHLSPDPFRLMKEEFREARGKIRSHRPTRWKEVLDDLMYTLNFHADLLPAEDHLLLRTEILPFVMNVMAALPLQSAKILMAVHEAGRLELIAGKAEISHERGSDWVVVSVDQQDRDFRYRMFIDCTGQAPVDRDAFPFKSLTRAGLVSPAVPSLAGAEDPEVDGNKLTTTHDGRKAVKLGGMAVADDYQMLTPEGKRTVGLYDIAVPHAAGLRPYCYGLQACNEAAKMLVSALCGERDLSP